MKKIKVLAGGCFNKIHEGHIYFLNRAKSFGFLTVVLANDRNNKKRYALPAKQRKENLKKLKIADRIIVGDENDYMKTVDRVKPDIIVLGYDQKLGKGIEDKLKGIAIVRLTKFGEYSTRALKR
ncbi:MAG: adenylyltransferase/cytidyltransferase family protein [Candidatus Aenigmatarchaeota archaeon]